MRPLVIAVCCASLGATTAPLRPQQQPVFRGGVELVTIDVTVVDKDGKPVKGLKPEDFVVALDGQARPVRALDFLEFGTSAGSTAAPSAETSNQQVQTRSVKRGGRVIVILFDDLSYRAGPGKSLTTAALRLLPTFDTDDLVGVATTSGMGPTVNPTRDRAALAAALQSKQMVGRYDDSAAPFFIGIDEALEIERGTPAATLDRVVARECPIVFPGMSNDGPCRPMVESASRRLADTALHRTAMQMAAYRAIITALRPAPAPRVVITLSSGVATSAVHGDLQHQLDPLSRAAAEAGVEFYALTEVADGMDMSDLSHDRAAARRSEGTFLNAGIQTVASAAGGEAFLVVGTADRFYKRIESETSGFYRLGVEAPVSTEKHRFVKTKVSVRQAGVTVRANREALVASAAVEGGSVDDRLRATLAQGGVTYGVPIALATALRRDPAASQLQLGVNVQVPAAVAAPLTAMFALMDPAGQVVQSGRKSVPAREAGEDYRLAFPVPVAAGRYRLRFAVADASGNVGSVEKEVVASLAHIGACSVSDLFTTWAPANGTPRFLALEALPEGATTLRATLELYPDATAAPLPDVTVHVALLRTGEDQPLVERDLTPLQNGTTLVVTAEMRVELLETGTYTIRATILESGAITGTVSASVRKAGG